MAAGSSVRGHSPAGQEGHVGAPAPRPGLWLRVPRKWGLPERHQDQGSRLRASASPQTDTLWEVRRGLHSGTRGATLPPWTRAARLGHAPTPPCAQPRPAGPSSRPAPDAGLPPHPGGLILPSLHPTQVEPGLSSAPSAWKSLEESGSPGLARTDPPRDRPGDGGSVGAVHSVREGCGGQGRGGGEGHPEARGRGVWAPFMGRAAAATAWSAASSRLSSGLPPLPLQEGRCSHHVWPVLVGEAAQAWPLYPCPGHSGAQNLG